MARDDSIRDNGVGEGVRGRADSNNIAARWRLNVFLERTCNSLCLSNSFSSFKSHLIKSDYQDQAKQQQQQPFNRSLRKNDDRAIINTFFEMHNKPRETHSQPPDFQIPQAPKSLQINSLLSSRNTIESQDFAEFSDDSDNRPFDVVIFGASGCVGSFVMEELALVVEKHYRKHDFSANGQILPVTSTHGLKELRDPYQFSSQNRRISVPRQIDEGFSWAIAGRSAVKLQEALCRAELSTGIRNLSHQVPVILADLQQHKSLIELCSKTQLIINCVGPYSIDGEAMIRACLKTRTNYIDLAHESFFLEQIRSQYHEHAQEAGIYIINGCGFQSMSAEMGLNYVKQMVDGQIDEVKIVLNLSDTSAHIRPTGIESRAQERGIVTYGMWSSLLTDRGQQTQPQASYKITSNEEQNNHGHDTSQRRRLIRKDTQELVNELLKFKRNNRSSFINQWFQLFRSFDNYPKSYCLPSGNFTIEESQLIRGEITNYQIQQPKEIDSDEGCWKPIESNSFISVKSFSHAIIMLSWILIFNLLSSLSLPRRLMKTFTNLASLGYACNEQNSRQLDRDSLNHIKYSQTFLVYGTPGANSGDPLEERKKNCKRKQEQLLVARIVGPEPNHIATATFACQAALALILERGHISPPNCGGVLTAGVAFAETNIIHQLRRRNIKFEVLKKA